VHLQHIRIGQNPAHDGRPHEILGILLCCRSGCNGVGVRDLQDTLNNVAEYQAWMSDLRPLPSRERARQNELNSRIASKHLRKVLAARIVVFQLFLQLAIEVDGKLQEKHKRIWLLFQLSNQLGPPGGTLHPFVQIIRKCLRHASLKLLSLWLTALMTF
jgi:hypothetical protein